MKALLRKFFELFEEPASLRAEQLLSANLTAGQRDQLETFGYFDVVGGDSGHRFRIHRAYAMNVEEYDPAGRCLCKWCFMPCGNLVQADILLAQKIALELFERDALAVAMNYPVHSRSASTRPRRYRQSRTTMPASTAA